MRKHFRSLEFLVSATTLLGSLPLAQDPGTVDFHRKISKTSGSDVRPDLSVLDQFGRSLALVGDLDGDGVQEIAIGAHGDDDGGTLGDESNVGAVHILFMRRDGSTKSISKISATRGGFTGSLANDDGFGRAIGRLGDFDGDGVPDLIVGANRDDDGAYNSGAVYFLYLTPSGTVKSHTKISQTSGWPGAELEKGDEFGRGMDVLGDLDCNGVPDVVVAATNDDDGARAAGALYVLFMNADGSVLDHSKISTTRGGLMGAFGNDHSFGMSVASLGDVDGDTIPDLLVGGIGDATGGFQTGAAWTLMLTPEGTVKSQHKIAENTDDLPGELDRVDQFGFSVAGPGDINGDGIPDGVIGAILDDDGSTETNHNAGAVYVCFFAQDGSVSGYQKISSTRGNFSGGLAMGDWWAASCTAIGDLNADGVPDIAAGARFDDDGGGDTGSIHLLFLNGTPGPGGGDTASDSILAHIGRTTSSGMAPLRLRLEDLSTGPVVSRTWTFGDGESSTEATPVHRYDDPGDYLVRLEAQAADGSTDACAFTVSVGELAAGSIEPLGCDDLVAGSLTVRSGSAALGSSLVFGVHNPLGTQAAGALASVHVALAPDPGFPCGTPLAGFGMAGAGMTGELLVGDTILSLTGAGWSGAPAEVTLPIPNLAVLAGLQVYVQGLLVDGASGAPVPFALTDGIVLTLAP